MLRERIQQGLRVTLIVDGTRSFDQVEQRALKVARDTGVLVIKAVSKPVPFVVLDAEVVWLGSMSPGDCLGGQEGLMTRSVSRRAAAMLLEQQGQEPSARAIIGAGFG